MIFLKLLIKIKTGSGKIFLFINKECLCFFIAEQRTNVQVCDATAAEQKTNVGYKKEKN